MFILAAMCAMVVAAASHMPWQSCEILRVPAHSTFHFQLGTAERFWLAQPAA